MPAGETEKTPSGLTVDTLNLLIQSELAAIRATLHERDDRYQQRWEAQEKAIREKNSTMEERLASMNEFRAQLGDVIARMMPRSEAESKSNENAARIVLLEHRHGEDVSTINSRLDILTGAQSGADRSRQIIAWVIAAIVGLITIGTAALILIDAKP